MSTSIVSNLTWRSLTPTSVRALLNEDFNEDAIACFASFFGFNPNLSLDQSTSPVPPAKLTYLSLPPQIPNSLHQLALDFFFSTYANPTDICSHRGFLRHVLEIHTASHPGSAISLATLAVGTFLFGSWMNRQHDTRSSRTLYAEAVSALKKNVEWSGNDIGNEEMVMTILLLQFYEVLAGILTGTKRSRAHLNGALAIIEHRGAQKFGATDLSYDLLLCVRAQVIEDSFQTKWSIPPEIHDWAGVRESQTDTPEDRLDTIKMKIANLQAMFHYSKSSPSLGPEQSSQQMVRIVSQARTIEQELACWYTSLPSDWFPIRIVNTDNIPKSVIQAGVYRDLCDVYPSIPLVATFNKYRSSLLRLKTVMLECFIQQPRSLTAVSGRAMILNQIQAVADDICASVPFQLGDRTEVGWLGDASVMYPCAPDQGLPVDQHRLAQSMGGWLLLEPLGQVLTLRVKLREGQKQWVGVQMQRIADTYKMGC